MEKALVDALSDRIWVGRLATDGDVLVFGREWQPKMPAKVRLFSVELREWRAFLSHVVRKNLAKVRNASIIRAAVDAYSTFDIEERGREAAEQPGTSVTE
jgi:hypothetical protein